MTFKASLIAPPENWLNFTLSGHWEPNWSIIKGRETRFSWMYERYAIMPNFGVYQMGIWYSETQVFDETPEKFWKAVKP